MSLVVSRNPNNVLLAHSHVFVNSSQLVDASRQGKYQIVLELLEAGANVNITATFAQGWSSTPLLEAARKGHRNVVELLLKFGADVYQQNILNERPLFLAKASLDADDCMTPLLEKVDLEKHPPILIQKAIQKDWIGFLRGIKWVSDSLLVEFGKREFQRACLLPFFISDLTNIILDYSDESDKPKFLIHQKNTNGESPFFFAVNNLWESSRYFFHSQRLFLEGYGLAEEIVTKMLDVGVKLEEPINQSQATTLREYAHQKNLPEKVLKLIDEAANKAKNAKQNRGKERSKSETAD